MRHSSVRRHLPGIICSLLLTAGMVSAAFAAEVKPLPVPKTAKCSVCGMFVEKYKEWVAQVVFTDGGAAFFDGPKDMFRYYFNMGRYDRSRKQADISAVFVTEYYSTKPIDAHKVWFVAGSDVYGPMGSELVPVDSEDHAREFMKDHAGKKILRFGDVTIEDIR